VQKASVSITKDGAYYVDKERVSEYSIESELKKVLSGQDEPTIILRAEEGVPIEDAVFVMDIANKNKYKVVLAVRPN
jgi:biopolymer transport protein ExbD